MMRTLTCWHSCQQLEGRKDALSNRLSTAALVFQSPRLANSLPNEQGMRVAHHPVIEKLWQPVAEHFDAVHSEEVLIDVGLELLKLAYPLNDAAGSFKHEHEVPWLFDDFMGDGMLKRLLCPMGTSILFKAKAKVAKKATPKPKGKAKGKAKVVPDPKPEKLVDQDEMSLVVKDENAGTSREKYFLDDVISVIYGPLKFATQQQKGTFVKQSSVTVVNH
eukprot:3639788-Amphidinium_carterae.1